MAEKFVIPIHGGDHCPGGPDPIPCLPGVTPWIVLKDIGVGQTFPADSTTVIVYQEVVNDYPDYFEADIFSGSDYYRVTVQQDGLYSFHFSLPWDELNVVEHSIYLLSPDPGPALSHVQYDRSYYQGANGTSGPIVTGTDNCHDEVRLAAGQTLHLVMFNPHATTDYHSRDDGGAYFEVRRIGSATTNGRFRDAA